MLQYLQGYLKSEIDHSDRSELAGKVHSYYVGHLPLIASRTLFTPFF
ncbi:MAG: hypothetical protein CL768_05575 [Chloroflexi bacterium]|nr:hypothetical protein [Chloroflexota bacterium]